MLKKTQCFKSLPLLQLQTTREAGQLDSDVCHSAVCCLQGDQVNLNVSLLLRKDIFTKYFDWK